MLFFLGPILGGAALPPAFAPSFSTREPVGHLGTNRFNTPANQVLTPTGIQVELPGLRPQALALSPNGRLLVTAGKTHELVVLDPVSGKVLQRVPLPAESDRDPEPVPEQILEPDKAGQLSFTGLIFSADGTRIYLANVDGSIKVFSVRKDGQVTPSFTIPLPPSSAPRRKAEVPAGLALSPDGKRLYVVLNLSNRLAEIEAASGRLLRAWEVGVAPFDVVLVGGKAYVSNWGGRRPDSDSLTGPAGRGTRVRVDPVRRIANEGSVSIIDLSAENKLGEIAFGTNTAPLLSPRAELLTGLHACALALSPDRRSLVVANAGSDTLSVISTKTDALIETIWARQSPADLFGAQPNALAFDRTGKKLFVCNGSQNALAVIDFNPGKSRLAGLIPVGWFPAAVVHDSRRGSVYVANIKGFSPGRIRASNGQPEFNSHQYHGTLSLLKVPSRQELEAFTRRSLTNMRYPLLWQAMLPARPGERVRPVPERAGEPGVFKHVIYIIKENRTYDQVFGDVPAGNGDPELCVFGERITPNQHKMVREFALLDNTYCSGIVSADGHQWADSGFITEYVERSFAGFPRSYVDGMGDDEIDALAYSPAGFIWDNALAHGRSIRDYGELAITEARWQDPAREGSPQFPDFYRDFTDQTGQIRLWSRPGIESLRPYLATNYVGWNLRIPDVIRAAQFIKELKEFEQKGTLPDFIFVCLPNDHTSGTRRRAPTPESMVADNDLAFGQIVDAVSHSKFWPQTCIFAIEDDPQSGWDHVSAYRTTAYVISPYTRRGAVVSTQYNQTSLLRTMELMLGLPPMNQFDATATPMFDCFSNSPDLTPFTAVTNNVPLDRMNPDPAAISDPLLRKNAYVSGRLPLEKPDQCPDDLLNRILWHAVKGSAAPYPAWATQPGEDKD